MSILSKADILNGVNDVVTVEFPELGGSLNLKPLSDGEFHKINALVQGGGIGNITTKPVLTSNGDFDKEATMNGLDFEVDVEKANEAKYLADCEAVAMSLTNPSNDEDYTVEDVKMFPAGVVAKIAVKIFEISGVDDPVKRREDIETFRDK